MEAAARAPTPCLQDTSKNLKINTYSEDGELELTWNQEGARHQGALRL